MCERWKVMNGILFSLIYKMCLLLTSGQTLISVTRRQTQGNCTKSSRCGISTQILERSFWVFLGGTSIPKVPTSGQLSWIISPACLKSRPTQEVLNWSTQNQQFIYRHAYIFYLQRNHFGAIPTEHKMSKNRNDFQYSFLKNNYHYFSDMFNFALP